MPSCWRWLIPCVPLVNWLITRLAHYVERRQGRLPRFRAGRPVVTRAAAE